MKAITLHQPWATLVALGFKKFETRSWPTKYRGELAIHAGKSQQYIGYTLTDGIDVDGVQDISIAAYLVKHAPQAEFPLGSVLCIAELVNCIPMTFDFIHKQSRVERAFGLWQVGRFAWELEVTKVFVPPIPARGMQGLWDWSNAQ